MPAVKKAMSDSERLAWLAVRDAPADYPRMVFKAPGAHLIHGTKLDYRIVAGLEAEEAAVADGWHLSTPEAVAAHASARDAEARVKQDAEDAKTLAAADAIKARAKKQKA